MSFADDLREIKAIDYDVEEKDRIEKEKKESIDKVKDQIKESFVDLKKRGELKEDLIEGFFYSEYWWDICHFKPYDKEALLSEALKKENAEYHISAFLIKCQKIFSEEVNVFEPLTADDIKKILEDLGFANVGFDVVPVKYYRKCRLGETIFREYVKDETNIFYFTFES